MVDDNPNPKVWGPKTQEQSALMSSVGKMDVPAQEEREFALASSFCSIKAPKVLDDVHLR